MLFNYLARTFFEVLLHLKDSDVCPTLRSTAGYIQTYSGQIAMKFGMDIYGSSFAVVSS